MTVLGPLAARYGVDRSGLPRVEIPPEPDGVVRAMPVVLRLERPPAARTPLLEAAARAALAVCLDPRAEPEGEWHDPVALWVDNRIRKIARRARGAHWDAVQELAGVTVDVEGAQARALLPGPVDEVPRVVARLQIGGTDLPDDDPGPPAPGVPGASGVDDVRREGKAVLIDSQPPEALRKTWAGFKLQRLGQEGPFTAYLIEPTGG